MIASKNVRQFFQPVLEALYATLHLPASVWLADETGAMLRIVASVQLPEAYSQEAYLSLSESLVAGRVFASGQPEIIASIAAEPYWKYKAEAAAEGLVAAMVVPVCRKTKIIGVLDVYTAQAQGFTAAEQKLIENFANQVAVAANYFQGLDLVGEVSLLINSELRLETLSRQIMQAAQKVLECEHVSMFLTAKGGGLELQASSAAGIVRKRFAPGEGLAGLVAQTGRSELVPDAQRHPRFVKGLSQNDVPERSLLLVPITQEAQVVGVISADKDGLNGFDGHDQTLLEAVAQQAAVAIHNAELFQSEKKQRQQAETLEEIARIVNSTQKREAVIAAVLEQLRKVIDYDSASVQLFQGEHRILGGPAETGDPRLRRDVSQDPLVRAIVEARSPRVIGDVTQEALWQVLPATAHVKSWIGAPLVVNDQVIGLLTIDHGQAGYYTPESGKIVAAFANQVAVAIHNSTQAKALTELNKVAQKLVSIEESPLDTRRLLAQIAESALDVLRADLVELYEYFQSKDAYTLPQITAGTRRTAAQPTKVKIYPDDAVYHLIRRPEPTYVKDSQSYSIISGEYVVERIDQPKERYAVREGIRSTAAIPLRVGDETVGLMFVNYRIPQAFTGEQRELIELFARQAAIALKNARRVRALAVLNELGGKLASRLKEEDILELIHEQASELMDTDNMYVALYEADPRQPDEYHPEAPAQSRLHGTLRFGLAFEDGQRRRDLLPRRQGQGRAETIIRSRQPLLIRTKAEARAWYAEPGHEDYQKRDFASWAGVPMLVADKVVGVIATHHPVKEHLYTHDDLNMLQAIAAQAAVALDNARLFYGVNRRLEALVGFGKKLTSSIRLTEQEILKFIHEQANALMDTHNMYIALYAEPQDMVRFGLAFQDGRPIQVAARKIDDARRGRTEEIIRTRQPIFILTKEESLAWYQQPGHAEFIGNPLASWIGVPILLGEKVLGVIATYHPTQDYVYSPNDLEILQGIAEQAAVALENARVYQQLDDKVTELECAQTEIADKERALVMTSLAMDVVHEINNLAGPIAPWITLAKRALAPIKGVQDTKALYYLDRVTHGAALMLQKAWDFKSPVAEPETINLKEMLESIVGQVETIAAAETAIHFECEPEFPAVRGIERQLATALYSVLFNATKAISGAGQINIRLRRDPEQARQVQITISDTGCGIAANKQSHVFEYGMSGWTDGDGNGYGLWRARSILKDMGGDIFLTQSTLGAGSTFSIVLPALEAPGRPEPESNGG